MEYVNFREASVQAGGIQWKIGRKHNLLLEVEEVLQVVMMVNNALQVRMGGQMSR